MAKQKVHLRKISIILALIAIYVAAALFSSTFSMQQPGLEIVWMPAGISLVIVLRYGNLWLVPIALISCITALLNAVPLFAAVGISVGNTIEIFICSWFVRRFLKGSLDSNSVQNVLRIIGYALLSATIAASAGIASLAGSSVLSRSIAIDAWITWWLSDGIAILLVSPLLTAMFQRQFLRLDAGQFRERAAFSFLLWFATFVIFSDVLPITFNRSLPYILIIFTSWSAFRFRLLETTMVSFLIACIAIVQVTAGRGPFIAPETYQTLLSLQIFLGIMSITGLVLTAVVRQKNETEETLRRVLDEMEMRVHQRTEELLTANMALSDDIAQRKQVEAQLQKSEEQYRRLVELSPNGVIVHSKGIVRLVNPSTLRIIGAQHESELLGHSVLDFVPEEDRGSILQRMQSVIDGKMAPALEERFIRFDGSLVDVEVVSIPFIYHNEPAAQVVFTDITVRKQAERSVRASEAKYKALIENSPDIIVRINTEYTIEYLHIPGIPDAQEAIGANVLVIVPEGFRMGLQQALSTLFSTGQTLRYEAEGSTPFDNIYRYFTFYLSAIYGADNTIVAAYVVARDVTERKKIEQSLRNERDLYEALVNSLPGIFYLFDEDGHFLRWNKNLEVVSGYSAQEIMQLKPLDFFAGHHHHLVGNHITKVFQEGWAFTDGKVLTKDGRYIAYYFTGTLMNIEGKNCLLGVGLDMTERKEAEARLRESEAKLREAQHAAHIGNYELDLATMTWEGSEELIQILGINSAFSYTVREFFQLVIPEYRKILNEEFQESLSARKSFLWDSPLIRPDGAKVWITGTGEIVYDESQKPCKMLGTVQDITTRKAIEEQLQRHNEELELRVQERTAALGISMEKERRFNQAKTEFVSHLSHEFRTPLTIILSSSELLERLIKQVVNPLPPHIERHLRNISLQIKTMADMLSGVSRLMTIQTTILREQPVDTDIVEFCRLTIKEYTHRYPTDTPRTIEFKTEVQSFPAAIQFTILQTALLELLHNADAYSPQGVTVKLQLIINEDTFILCVHDYGKGVPPEEQESIFELFRRGASDMETGVYRGLGIGLTVAKMCVEGMNGKITCHSGVNEGSKFCVELPLQSEQSSLFPLSIMPDIVP